MEDAKIIELFFDRYETAGGEVYIYTDEQDTLIQFSYTSEPDNEKVYVDSVEYTEKTVAINDTTGTIFTSSDETATDGIVWTDPSTNTLFFIFGHFDEATLIEMAQGVKEK